MKKKSYVTPSCEVISLHSEGTMLSGSLNIGTGSEEVDGGDAMTQKKNAWDRDKWLKD